MEALHSIREPLGASFEALFETITTDNGTEFSRLPELEEGCGLSIYYVYPYCPSDKEMIENMNRIIRRFIPKGKRLEDCTADEIIVIQQWLRDLPRKRLGCHTAQECFLSECHKASILLIFLPCNLFLQSTALFFCKESLAILPYPVL